MSARRLLAAAFALLFCVLSLFGCKEEAAGDPCADGHTPSDWIILLLPTEETEGRRQKICTVCGVTLEVEPIERVAPADDPADARAAADRTDATGQTGTAGTAGSSASVPAGQTGTTGQTTDPPAPVLLAFTLLESGTYAVRAGDGAAGVTAITIPATHEGKTVTEITEDGFSALAALQSVTLSDTITKIGARAFSNCAALADIDLPASLISVGADAFAGCAQLTVTEEGYGRYLGVAGASVRVLLSVTDPSADYFAPAHGTVLIADDAFSNCPALTDLLLPTTLRAVGGSLAACTSLQAVFTDMTAAEWAALPGADALPAGAAVYTRDAWHYVHGNPAPN